MSSIDQNALLINSDADYEDKVTNARSYVIQGLLDGFDADSISQNTTEQEERLIEVEPVVVLR